MTHRITWWAEQVGATMSSIANRVRRLRRKGSKPGDESPHLTLAANGESTKGGPTGSYGIVDGQQRDRDTGTWRADPNSLRRIRDNLAQIKRDFEIKTGKTCDWIDARGRPRMNDPALDPLHDTLGHWNEFAWTVDGHPAEATRT